MTDFFRGEMWIAGFLKCLKNKPYQGAPADQFLKRFYNPTSNNNHGETSQTCMKYANQCGSLTFAGKGESSLPP
jgi:hypothetical protein